MAIKIGLDVSDLKTNGAVFLSLLKAQGLQVQEIASSMAKLNRVGDATGAIIKGITTDGNNFTATFKSANQTLALTTVQLTKVNDKYREAEKLAKALAKAEAQEEAAARKRLELRDKQQPLVISPAGAARLAESQVIRRGVRGALDEASTSIKDARDLSIEIGKLQAATDGANTSSEQWRGTLTRLSTAFGISQIDAAKVAYEGVQSGIYKANGSTIALEEALKLSKITTLSTAQSVEVLGQVMESYRIPAEGASKVTNILDDTLIKSRVSASQFSTEFAKLSQDAAASGVPIQEVAAVLQTMQKNGYNFATSVKTIESALEQLKKPGKEVQEVFKDLGIGTGQELLQSKGGLGGVLEFFGKLQKTSKDGSASFGSAFEVLAQKSVIGKNALDGYAESLDHVKGLTTEADDKARLLANTTGEKLNKELAKVQAYFTNGFGRAAIEEVVNLNDNGISLSGTLQTLTPYAIAAGAAFLAFKASAIVGNEIVGSYNSLQIALGGVVLEEKEAAAAGKQLGASIGLVSVAFIAGYAAGELLFKNVKGTYQAANEAIEDATERTRKFEEANKDAIKEREKLQEALTTSSQASYDRQYNKIQDYLTKVHQAYQKSKDDQVKALKETDDAIKSNATGLFTGPERELAELISDANKARSAIEESKKSVDNINNASESTSFNIREKYASPGHVDRNANVNDDQQTPLLKARIKEVFDEEKKYSSLGTQDGIQEARKLNDERRKLVTQLFEHETSLQKEQFAQRVRNGTQGPTGFNTDGSARYEFTVRTKAIEKEINDISKERIAAELAFQDKQAEVEKTKLALAEKKKVVLADARKAVSEAASFNPLDENGNLKKQYQGKDGRQKAIDDYNALEASAVTKLPDGESQLQLIAELGKKRVEIERQVQNQISDLKISAQKKEISDRQKLTDDTIQNLKAVLDRSKAIVKEGVDKDLPGTASAVGNIGQESFGSHILRGLITTDSEGFYNTQHDFDTAKQKYEEQVKILSQSRTNGTSTEGVANNAEAVLEAAKKYAEAAAILQKYKTGKDDLNQSVVTGEEQGKSAQDRINEFIKKNEEVAGAARNAASAEQQSQGLLGGDKALAQSIGDLPGTFDNANAAVKNLTDDGMKNFIDRIFEANNALQSMPSNKPAPEPDRNLFGGLKYFNKGGFTDFIPKGSDRIPAMLARGEAVINADATSQWAPVIQAMNSGALSNKSTGNSQIANFGDVNINIDGSKMPTQTGVEVAKSLRRLVQRGMAQLS